MQDGEKKAEQRFQLEFDKRERELRTTTEATIAALEASIATERAERGRLEAQLADVRSGNVTQADRISV